jgi:hypothetical protein
MAIQFNKLNGGAVKSSVTYMKLVDGENTFRILPDSIVCMYTYWIKGANGKDLPFEALQFSRETEKFDNSIPCPISDLKLKDAKGESIRCQWAYKCQVINKATGSVEVLQLKKGILTEIIDVSTELQVDPTTLDTGIWFTVNRVKTGPLAYNVEYSLRQMRCKSTPLEESDLEKVAGAKTMAELFPIETYAAMSKRISKHLSGEKESEQEPESEAAKEAIDDLTD